MDRVPELQLKIKISEMIAAAKGLGDDDITDEESSIDEDLDLSQGE